MPVPACTGGFTSAECWKRRPKRRVEPQEVGAMMGYETCINAATNIRACCNSKLRTLRGQRFWGIFSLMYLKQREPRLVRPTALVDIGSLTMYPEETNVAREKPWLDMGNRVLIVVGFPPLGRNFPYQKKWCFLKQRDIYFEIPSGYLT